MPHGEKNQDMKYSDTSPTSDRLIKRPIFFVSVLITITLAWGCTVAPTKKLLIKNTTESFEAGTIFSSELGKPVTFEDLLTDLANCQVIYVGEQHTDAAHHKIQLEIIQAVFKNNPHMAVGMEMFDHTYQHVLDQWSQGELDQKDFLRKTHWYVNWRFDFALYSDILEFIKEHHIRLVALNIPSQIPPKIREGGIDSLSDEEKAHLPKQIDLNNSAHRDYLKKVFEEHKHHFRSEVEFDDFYAAQSVWEDAMAEKIAQNLNDAVMVVLAGDGHIQFKYGIPDRAFNRTDAPFRTIYLAPVGSELEEDIADYIWVTQ